MRRTGALGRILVVSLSLFIEIGILGSFYPARAGPYFGLEKGNTRRLELRHPLLLVQAEEGPTLEEVSEEKEKELYEQKAKTETEILLLQERLGGKATSQLILLGLIKIGIVLVPLLFPTIYWGADPVKWKADPETWAYIVLGVDTAMDMFMVGMWIWHPKKIPPGAGVATIANMAKNGVFLYLILAEVNKENPSPKKITNLTWGCVAGTVLIPFLVGTGYEIHYLGLRRKLKSKEEDLEEIEQKLGLRNLNFYYNPERTRWEITYKIKFK